MVENICKYLNCDRASIFIYDNFKKELWSYIAKGLNKKIKISVNKGIIGFVCQKKEKVNIKNAYEDCRFDSTFDKLNNYHTKSILAFPILNSMNEINGVIQAINKKNNNSFDIQDEIILEFFSSLISVILKNSLIYDEKSYLYDSLKKLWFIGYKVDNIKEILIFLKIIKKELLNYFNTYKLKIFIVDEKKKTFYFFKKKKKFEFSHENGLIGKSIKNKKTTLTTAPINDKYFNKNIDIDTCFNLVTIPLIYDLNQEIVGAVQFIKNTVLFKEIDEINNFNIKELESYDNVSRFLGSKIFNLKNII